MEENRKGGNTMLWAAALVAGIMAPPLLDSISGSVVHKDHRKGRTTARKSGHNNPPRDQDPYMRHDYAPDRINECSIPSRGRSLHNKDEAGSSRKSRSMPSTRARTQSPHRTIKSFSPWDYYDPGERSNEAGFTSDTDYCDDLEESGDEDFYPSHGHGNRVTDKIYAPLQGELYIRVMKLHKGEQEDPLHCTLSQIPLDGPDDYDFQAISYVWGHKYPPKTLFCNDKHRLTPIPLEITASLHSAPVRFRHPDRDRWLWADAVCINQDDPAEKSKQVLLMAQIYTNASRTLIWLGYDERGARCLDFFYGLDPKSKDDHVVKEEIREVAARVFGDESYRPLKLFFQDQEYFSRRWVIQEVAQSRYPVIYCGDSKVNWKDFAAGVNLLTKHPPREFDIIGIDVEAMKTIQHMNALNVIQDQPFGILDLLTGFHSSDCER
jgi:hypothetical protein